MCDKIMPSIFVLDGNVHEKVTNLINCTNNLGIPQYLT
jgi:hypothetical protein